MNESSRQAILETASLSGAGRLHFAEVVRRLVDAGVESYHVDYRAGRTTYYVADGQALACEGPLPESCVVAAFDADAIQAAIRGAQRGDVAYPEFRRRSREGGCVSYTVWIAGRHVVYHGRYGETHVERFPD